MENPTHSTMKTLNEHNQEDRFMAMLIYLLSFATNIIGPLIIWIIKRETSSFVDRIGKDYFNFMISYMLWFLISGFLSIILIGIPIFMILAVLSFIFTIIGAIKAYEGETYLPPLSIPFFK